MKPVLYMLCGLPASGKTQYSLKLQKEFGAPCFSLDEEYFRKVGNIQQKHRDSELEREVEESFKTKIAEFLKNGQSVIFDYCPWQKARRDEYRKWSEQHGAEVKIFYFKVSKEELLCRLDKRNKLAHKDFQFVTPEMLEDFYKRFEEPIGEGETVVY